MVQRGASHFPAFSEATDVSTCAELHILALKRGDFAISQTCLYGEQQEGSVTPADPFFWIRSCNDSRNFFIREELNRTALVPFGRDSQNPLTVQCQCRFTEGHIAKETLQGGKAVISCADAITAVKFKVLNKLAQERHIELFYAQFRRRTPKVFRGEAKQQTEGIPVRGNSVRTGAKLCEQSVRKETL
jgi:hypothetical protein